MHARVSVGKVNIFFFNKIILKDVLIEDQKADTLLNVEKLVASVEKFSIKKRKLKLSSVSLQKTKIYVSLDENRLPNYKFLLDAFRGQENEAGADNSSWDISCRDFLFEETRLGYSYFQKDEVHLIDLYNIHLDVTHMAMNNDSISFRINQLSFDDNKFFHLKDLSCNFISYQHVIKLNDLILNTPLSKISGADVTIDQTGMEKVKDPSVTMVDIDMKGSSVNLQDIAQFVPSLRGMDSQATLSGHIFGTIADLKGRDLSLGLGDHTRLTFDFYINGLPDFEKAYINLDLKNSTIDFKDIAKVRLPESLKKQNPDIPSLLFDAGVISYDGNFTGFLSNFVAYGNVRSNFGRLKMDLSFVPSGEDLLDIDGHLKTVNFKLGKFIKSGDLGAITFNGQVNGSYEKQHKLFRATTTGVIDSVFYSSYRYKNIKLDGQFQDKKFDGSFSIKDKNLEGHFDGKVDFNPNIPVFDFDLLLEKANLVALHVDKLHKKSDLAFDLKANFTGNNIDNINGSIWFDDGFYANENDSIALKSLTLNTYNDSVRHLMLQSDYLDAKINGTYSLSTLKQSFKNLVTNYIPESGWKYTKHPDLNRFTLDLNIKNAGPITQTFMPELNISPTEVFASFDEQKNLLDVYTDIPRIRYNNIILNGYSFSLHANEKIELKTRLDELQIDKDKKLFNLSLISDAKDNELNSKLTWNNNKEKSYSGEIEADMNFSRLETGTPHVEMHILPTKIYIADTLWNIHPSTITIDSTRIAVDKFTISNKNQSFTFSGAVSKDKADRLNIAVKNFSLENLTFLEQEGIPLKGSLNGTASIFDIYEKSLFLSDLRISGLNFAGQQIGDVSIVSKWDRPSESLQAELIADDNNHRTLYGYGSYYPTRDSLDFSINANRLPLSILKPVLEDTFDDVKGYGTGELKIYGKSEKILMRGNVYGENAEVKIGELQLNYQFSDTVKFRGDSIVFDHITIHDPEGNSGIFDGSLRHDNFSNMDYNMTLSSRKILALNTTAADNERFYGKAYANGILSITGHAQDVYFDCSARTLIGTSINISLDDDKEAQVYDFLRFVNPKEGSVETTAPVNEATDESRLFMKFNIDVTPEAKFQLIYNSQVGDIIKGQGSGNLQVNIDPNYNISLFGNFKVERGDYLFTLKNVINKKFEIEQGGMINWNGDPYSANVDLNAIYKLKASLKELFANSTDADFNQRVQVECKIALTDNLNNPTIGFDINFPMLDDRIKEEVRQYFNNQEDMNKQILSLLVLGRFYTPEYLRGTYEASNANLVGTTASELFSNQLSNWLSKINNDFDIGVNYRPGDEITNDEIELALSTQMLNDRVTINGNIGNNGSQTTTANNSDIIGDFDLNVKITNNGKLQFKAYNHSNDNIIYDTSPYTQGIGLSYHENYDTFHELWQKIKHLFNKKKKNRQKQ